MLPIRPLGQDASSSGVELRTTLHGELRTEKNLLIKKAAFEQVDPVLGPISTEKVESVCSSEW
jgi:hypothetical protein